MGCLIAAVKWVTSGKEETSGPTEWPCSGVKVFEFLPREKCLKQPFNDMNLPGWWEKGYYILIMRFYGWE